LLESLIESASLLLHPEKAISITEKINNDLVVKNLIHILKVLCEGEFVM